jgi:hypothetical protein
MNDVTRTLSEAQKGGPRPPGQLLPLAYHELREVAAGRVAQGRPAQALRAAAPAGKKIFPRPHTYRPAYALI